MLQIEETPLKDCLLLKPEVFRDQRGSFSETFSNRRFREITGMQLDFVQDNQSTSTRGVLRGLHFQKEPFAQAKLVRCVLGEVMDVVVDLRPDSSTFKEYYKVKLNDQNHYQLFVPRGFAHGFLTLSERSIFSYKCDAYYHAAADTGIFWDDPELAIEWEFPKDQLILSAKDQSLPLLKSLK